MDKARFAAAKAVLRLHKGGWANLAAKQALSAPGLNARDKNFAAALFYGTAERLVTLDYLLQPHLKKPLEKMDAEVRAVLETGLYQIMYMDVPPRAAVDEAVKLTRGLGKTSAAGLVNAVLRRAGAHCALPASFADEAERVQVTWSLSPAVAAAVMQALPQDYEAFLEASFAKRELCLRCNTLKTTAPQLISALLARGDKARAGSLPNAVYAHLASGVGEDPLFLQGSYHVQGEASQYVCAALQARPGQKILDLCAAPGGKSATLAQQLGGGAGLTACDLHPHRVQLIRENFRRLGVAGATVLQNDATIYTPSLAGQDAVLCDVPCSGLGVMAAKPDIRYADGHNFDALPALQLKILATAARYVRQGGRLVYATCTIRPQENAQVVRQFLQNSSDFTCEIPEKVPANAKIEDNMVTILPQTTGLDGFFVASMERL